MKTNKIFFGVIPLVAEVILLATLFSTILSNVIAGIGNPNATQISNRTFRNSFPEVLNVRIEEDSVSTTLIPNSTTVSGENASNVINFGNVELKLSLEGYGFTVGDGNAMNCTLGATGNISARQEKHNLIAPSPGDLNIAQANANHTNLTTLPRIKDFNLRRRTNDTVNNSIQQTYWRIYVPEGVAGTCTGNIVFGATTANGA